MNDFFRYFFWARSEWDERVPTWSQITETHSEKIAECLGRLRTTIKGMPECVAKTFKSSRLFIEHTDKFPRNEHTLSLYIFQEF